MTKIDIETCWNAVLWRKNILINNSALVGMNLYLISMHGMSNIKF
jgi:hypothetical protein